MEYILINSKENKFFKLLKKLNDKKTRDENNLYLLEGDKFLNEVKEYRNIIVDSEKKAKFDLSAKSNVVVLDSNLFNQISSHQNSQGIIFLLEKQDYKLENIESDIVILDNIQDPGNLGTIIRTLVALDFKTLVLTNDSCDCYNSKVIRSSMGAILKINIVYKDKKDIIDYIKKNGYNIVSTALSDDSVQYSNMKIEKKNAYIFGSEGKGISSEFLDVSNQKIIVPISENVDSLNIGVCLGIIMYKVRELR